MWDEGASECGAHAVLGPLALGRPSRSGIVHPSSPRGTARAVACSPQQSSESYQGLARFKRIEARPAYFYSCWNKVRGQRRVLPRGNHILPTRHQSGGPLAEGRLPQNCVPWGLLNRSTESQLWRIDCPARGARCTPFPVADQRTGSGKPPRLLCFHHAASRNLCVDVCFIFFKLLRAL